MIIGGIPFLPTEAYKRSPIPRQLTKNILSPFLLFYLIIIYIIIFFGSILIAILFTKMISSTTHSVSLLNYKSTGGDLLF